MPLWQAGQTYMLAASRQWTSDSCCRSYRGLSHGVRFSSLWGLQNCRLYGTRSDAPRLVTLDGCRSDINIEQIKRHTPLKVKGIEFSPEYCDHVGRTFFLFDIFKRSGT